jgi:hypothetical protein
MSEQTAILRAIERGVAFLDSVQLPNGEIPIEASPTPEMTGDCVRDPVVFTTALAARALALTPSAAGVRTRALDFLMREMEPDGLWRYPSLEHPGHDHIPLDVDDTSIASAALVAAGRRIPDNRALLVANRNRRGLFRTWIVRWWPHPRKIYRFFRESTANMGDVDAAINANVVSYLGKCTETQAAITEMLSVLRANAELRSTKWYEGRFSVWYFFSHALRDIAPEAGEMIVPRLETATPRNGLESALATSTLLLWNRVADVQPLIDAQLPSGAWPRAGFYHAGLKRTSSNQFQPTPPWWGSEALTTVLAVEALSRRIA